MTNNKEYLEHVLGLLSRVTGVTHHTVMDEYLLYSKGALFGSIYDDKSFPKDVPAAREVFPLEQEPYEGTHPMLPVSNEDLVQISDMTTAMIPQLAASGTKRRRK